MFVRVKKERCIRLYFYPFHKTDHEWYYSVYFVFVIILSFRGYVRSHSISCTLSFLTKRENENGIFINKIIDIYCFGKGLWSYSKQRNHPNPVKVCERDDFRQIS